MSKKSDNNRRVRQLAAAFIAVAFLVVMIFVSVSQNKDQISEAADAVITAEPQDITVIRGSKGRFTVKAEGTGLTYQWQVSTNGGESWAKSSADGCTTSSIVVTATKTMDGRMFRCCVTKGNTKYYSQPAKLTTLAVLSVQPKDSETKVGNSAVFTVKSRSSKASFQWEVNTGSGWKKSGADGNTSASLTVTASATMNNYKFRCKVTNGTWTEYSNTVTLKIKPAITKQPANTTGYNGYTTKFYVTAKGVNLKYQWQVYTAEGKWVKSSSEGNDTRALAIKTSANLNGKKYRCKITSGSYVIYTNVVVLKVKTKILTQPENVNVMSGNKASFSVKAVGTGLTYQWQVSTDGGSTWKKSGATGAATSKITVNATEKFNMYRFRCIITDGSLKTISDSAILSVSAALTDDEKAKLAEIKKYSYKLIPLTNDICNYFLLQTDNPDPNSFVMFDEKSKYSDEKVKFTLAPLYSDVKYENTDTLRVKGGYIFNCGNTDGGTISLKMGVQRSKYDNGYYYSETVYIDTGITLSLIAFKDRTDYLIDKYVGDKTDFFDKMDAIQSGFSSECLYQGVWIRGELHKSETSPYYGISTSPHVDQIFYIQDPYYRDSSKPMLISYLYPLKYDSIGFPSMMTGIAKRLEPTATYEWSTSAHYLVDITFNGKTKTYGGAGHGGGQEITESDIIYWYKFDGSSDDACRTKDIAEIKSMVCEYGALTIPTDKDESEALTWAKVRKQVGEGKYVRLILLTSIFGGSSIGYTYLYDDGSTTEGSQGWGNIGHMYNTWFEGRYYNKWEYYYPGATFEKTVEDVQPSITIKDPVINIPKDGKEYFMYGTRIENGRYVYKARPLSECGYDSTTGKFKGYYTYYYHADKEAWDLNDFTGYVFYKDENGKEVYIDDNEEFKDSLTITMEEAKAMNLDKNTNVDPSSFLIYDMKSEPGTKGSN